MPELPDIAIYLEALTARISGQPLERIRIQTPFLLRSVAPPPQALEGRTVHRFRRLGKRIAIGLDGQFWIVLHLMIAGRLHWKPHGAKLAGRNALAAFDFPNGTLTLTEAGTQRRASLYLAAGDEALEALARKGIEPLDATLEEFHDALTRENHTLKRVLTDPDVFSGIGNAYSDEILHRARLSPIAHSQKLDSAGIERLYHAVRATLLDWIDRLRAETGSGFPEHVTAFRSGMAVHGRFGEPCPDCGAKVQRIRYATNETNYCARCQTAGRVLADRSLSRLLGEDFPRTLD